MSEIKETKGGAVEPQAPDFTTERFYVEHVHQHGRDMLIRHVRRYKWAATHLKQGANVLDIGCGSGYGDFILLGKAAHVLGMDMDGKAIDYAATKARLHGNGHLSYLQHDVTQPVANSSVKFDAIVCIEMFEHVSIEDQAQLLQNVTKWMEPGGVFLMTTPEKGQARMTEHHVNELTRSELDALLSVAFDDITYDDPAKFGLPDNFILAVCRSKEVSE